MRWYSVLVAAATAAMLLLPFTIGDGAQRLLDRHGDPTPKVAPASMVAVTEDGKLYHDPRCTFIHGRPLLRPESVATERGMTPCPRCLGALRAGAADYADR